MEAEGIIFDLGNLISDPFDRVMELKSKEIKDILENTNTPVKKEELVRAWADANKSANYAYASHFFQETQIISKALEKIKIPKQNADQLASQLIPIYRDGLRMVIKNDKMKNEVKDVLEFLKSKNKKIAVISSEKSNAVKSMIKWADLEKYFDRVVSTEEIGFEKINLTTFRYMLNTLGTRVSGTVYVGSKNDIEPAKMTGLKTVMITDEKQNVQTSYKPDFVVKKISEIKNIIS
jgi:HAD superfamily hydrolase (TIGR01549 family)